MRDPYVVLAVEPTATDEEIKASYRKLALRWHPDRNPDDSQAEEKFKEAAAAYEILSDPEKRRKLDRWRARQGQGQVPTATTDALADDLGKIFGDFIQGFVSSKIKDAVSNVRRNTGL